MINKTKLYTIIILSVVFSVGIKAQSDNQQKPCSQPEASQFDFWLGEWDVSWEDQNGNTQHGTNIIGKVLDGCVVEENFNGNPGMAFLGKSHSVYNRFTKKWHQTWVDNSGGYLDFIGGMEGDKMILSRSYTNPQGQEIHQRMVWYDIGEDQLEWNWERSTDGGENWTLLWNIHYERKTES